MAIPLVYMFPNSTTLVLAGSWNNSPGDKRMNKTTATTTGPQSALISFLFSLYSDGGLSFLSIASRFDKKRQPRGFKYGGGRIGLIFLVTKEAGMRNLVRKKTVGL
jgi:hypothetical protein